MRDTVGYTPRRRRKPRPCDSFAYAGGEIAVRKLPVPDLGTAPVLPAHLTPIAQPPAPDPDPSSQTPNPKDINPIMENPSPVALPAPPIEEARQIVALQARQTDEPRTTDLATLPTEEASAAETLEIPVAATRDLQSVEISRSEEDRHPDQNGRVRPAPPVRVSYKPRHRSGQTEINLKCHESHCTICKHQERQAIEQAFLHWWSPMEIAIHFNLGNRMVVYRHAHAFDLFQRRTARTRHALEHIVEHAEAVAPTADSVIRAVRALGCLDENGRWAEPPKRVIVTHEFLDTRVEKKMNLIPSQSAT